MANLPTYAPLPPSSRLDSEWDIPDSEWAKGMSYATFLWLDTTWASIDGLFKWQAEHFEQRFYGLKFLLTTTNSKVAPGIKDSYGLLPFRALEDHCLPAAIQQRWEASVAASKSAEWRLWFRKLNPEERKVVVQVLSKRTKDKFWAGLPLKYVEWSKPRRTQHVAAAAKAHAFLEREYIRTQMEVLKWDLMVANYQRGSCMTHPFKVPLHLRRSLPAESPEPLSAPVTPQTIASLRLRVVPSYFRVPNHALQFATQIFWGKSYEEAVVDQKVDFNSSVQEAKTMNVEGIPDYVVYGNFVLHKDDLPGFTTKKNQPATGKRRHSKRRKAVSKSTEERGC